MAVVQAVYSIAYAIRYDLASVQWQINIAAELRILLSLNFDSHGESSIGA